MGAHLFLFVHKKKLEKLCIRKFNLHTHGGPARMRKKIKFDLLEARNFSFVILCDLGCGKSEILAHLGGFRLEESNFLLVRAILRLFITCQLLESQFSTKKCNFKAARSF